MVGRTCNFKADGVRRQPMFAVRQVRVQVSFFVQRWHPSRGRTRIPISFPRGTFASHFLSRTNVLRDVMMWPRETSGSLVMSSNKVLLAPGPQIIGGHWKGGSHDSLFFQMTPPVPNLRIPGKSDPKNKRNSSIGPCLYQWSLFVVILRYCCGSNNHQEPILSLCR
jgi:hypothetical protein